MRKNNEKIHGHLSFLNCNLKILIRLRDQKLYQVNFKQMLNKNLDNF